jgi:hypothetical protein
MTQFRPGLPDRSQGRPTLPVRSRPAQPGGDWCGGDPDPDPGWCGGGELPEPWCDSNRAADTIVLGAVAGLVRALGRRLS